MIIQDIGFVKTVGGRTGGRMDGLE